MPMLKGDLETWSKINYMPVKLDSIMSLAIMDARRLEERKAVIAEREDFYTAADQMKNLNRIKERFNIKLDEEHFNSD